MQFVAYEEAIAERVRNVLAQVGDVQERKMFGGLCFTVRGHMVIGVMADHIMLRLGNDLAAQALQEPHTAPMDFTGRVLKSMLYVHAPGFAGAKLDEWIGRGLAFNETMPAK